MQRDRDQGSGTRDQGPVSLTEKLLIVAGSLAAMALCCAALVHTADLHRPVHPPNANPPTNGAMTPDAGALGRVEPTEKRPAIAGTGDAAAPADAAGVRDDRTPAAGEQPSVPSAIGNDRGLKIRATLQPVIQASGPSSQPRIATGQSEREPTRTDLRPLLDAIRRVESSGYDAAVGDGGRSLGPYQLSADYWADAAPAGWDYQDRVWDRASCEAVMVRYWQRYAPAALGRGDWQTLARVHNGGPAGGRKAATLAYWRKVQRELNAAHAREVVPRP